MFVSTSSDLMYSSGRKDLINCVRGTVYFTCLIYFLLWIPEKRKSRVVAGGWLCSEMSDADHERGKFRERGCQRELC